MKRSQMLNTMAKEFLKHIETPNTYWNIASIGVCMSNILEEMEIKGMIPPIEPGRTVYDLDLGVPEWEPEDET